MMSFKEFKATVSTNRVAGPQKEINTIPTKPTVKKHQSDSSKEHTNFLTSNTASSSPSSSTSSLPSATSTTMQEEQHVKMCKLFTFIEDTYRDIRRFNSGLYKDSYSTQLMQSINKYKNGCNEIFGKVLESYDMSFMLSQNIVRTIDIFKELGTCLTDMEEYQYRICEIMSIFIVCELRLSVDANPQDQLSIAHRIIYIMRRHLVQEEEHETLYNILRTLVYIPKLYNARDIMCAIFGEFIPIKPVPEVNVLPDKLYMLYIIVFYRWMMMQKDDDDKLLIVNFAESFMKPSVSLCSNNLYGAYLPMYTTHSTATRTILNNLKFYRDIRNASIIDNALKTIGSVVNLCDDDEDEDVIVIDSSPATEFAQIFGSALLEPLNGNLTHVKLEEKTVVGLVDLTMEEEPTNSQNSIVERHDKWLNEFQQLAKQYREAQLLLEKQQNNQLNASLEKETVICLDSDTEEEAEEEISAAASKKNPETAAAAAAEEAAATENKPCEDLFIDNYPLTNTPIHCDTDLESLDADDNDDATKISSRFFTGTLRTYQAKKSTLSETEDKNHTDGDESNSRSMSMNNAYRRDSIHISSSPPDGVENEEDEGTDVQDEHDDGLLDEEEEEEEDNAYTFLPTTSKQTESAIRPMGPYPTYNNMHNNNDKLVLSQSQSLSRYQPDKQYYSDSSEVKARSKQKKRVQFNTSPLGPTASSTANLKMPLKPALQQQKYKAADAPEYFHLRGFERFPGGPSVASSTSTSISTSSSIKQQEQQEHLAAAATLFRNIFDRPRVPYPYPAPFSPSSSSMSSPSTATPKKSRLPKNKLKQRRPTIAAREDLNNMELADNNHTERFSIIRNREVLNDGYHSTGPPGMSSYVESSDECYGVVSDSDIFLNERYKDDAKLRKRCAVVITPTKELLQYERKRDEMYNEILIKQRRKLELRTMAKQREKERRRLSKEKKEQTQSSDKEATDAAFERVKEKPVRRKSRNYTEIFMSSESEFETNFQVRTRKQRQKILPDLQPLNIEIGATDATTTSSLLSQIDAHLNSPQKSKKQQPKKQPAEQATANDSDINQITCDNNDPGQQTKMRELNLLADIAQHLSPYQLQLPETDKSNQPPSTPLPAPNATPTPKPKDKITVTEHLIIISSCNPIETTQTQPQPQVDINDQQQQATIPSYAHEPKLNIAAILNSSPSEKSLLNQNPQNNTPLKHNDNTLLTNNVPDKVIQTEETLEQLLEESISVLKSVTSPFNPLNECTPSERAETQSESTIPLLISNVESLNRYETNDLCVAKQKPNDKEHLLSKETTNENSEKLVLNANGETNEKPKDLMMVETDNASENVLSSTILNNVESSILCAADLSNISSETEIAHGIKVPSLMTADLSDISLESDISKHLPDIAEPSPVVTDMSDNSNDSCVSKTFGLQTPIINNNSTTHTAEVPVMSLPDLSFVMPSLTQPPATLPTNQQDCLERNFNHINSTLNTPIKLADMPREEEAAANPLNDLNTPLKFALAPVELENHNTPLKIALEPENDNNVTKFLDLILNKTVTDAESETRDKIIKELNALTADTTATATDTSENDSNNEITPSVETATVKDTSETGINTAITPPVETATTADTSETGSNNKLTPAVETATATDTSETGSNNEITPPVETELPKDSGHKTIETMEAVLDKDSLNLDKPLEQTNELKDHENDTIDDSIKSQLTLENNNSSQAAENNDVSQTILEEDKTPTELLSDDDAAATTTELKTIPSSPIRKIKAAAIKQTFKIKCRVRLKRLNIDEHSKSSKKKTWMAIPITKPEEPDKSANNDMKNCDNMTETKSLLKKTCLKPNNKRTSDELENKSHEGLQQEVAPTAAEVTTAKKPKLELEQTTTSTEVTTAKKPKLEHEQTTTPAIETTPTALTQQQPQLQSPAVALSVSASASTPALPLNNNPTPKKSKSKHLKTVTFDLSNLNEELRGTSSYNHKHKSKNHTAGIAAGALGCYLKNSRPPRKLPDNTLRAAETLQLFVNTINDSTRTPPPAEFNKKRSPIKNKCIAEDETPRPPPASTLMDTPPCKKVCTEKSRSQISSSKCKDQLVSSLATASISTISSDITTARIYTSSPLDQTLPEYDDNVDTVADSELILPNTAGSLRRKVKRPKKSLTRPVPVDDISTDDISNQPECNGEDDTDAVVDNEDDVFAEELLPIPAANEHILEEIVSARPSHIGSGTVIRDDYMNIEATATVPVYLFNDESRDLATPEPIQSSGDTTNVVDSSSYLNSSSSAATHNAMQAATASTTSSTSSSSLAMGNLEKSMLSPSEHEVSSTQETFYQTPTKSKQTCEGFGDKSSTSKDKGVGGSSTMSSSSQKQKPEDSNFQNKDDQTSSTTGLLQNNQVDTTNHSPEMCTLALTPNTTTSPAMTSNHKIRKASTHDEILFNELQQQQQQQAPTKRKNTTTTTTFCAESTSDNNSKTNKVMSNTPDDNKSNRSLNKEHKLKKLLKEACKRDKNLSANDLVDAAAGVVGAVNTAVGGGGGGGSSPSTTTIINEEKLSSKSKRKKQKSSKSNKVKNHGERSTKIVLKASKLAAHVPNVNPLIITIPKSRLLRPPTTPSEDQLPQNEFLDIPNAKLFTEKEKDKVITTPVQSSNQKQQQPHHHHHQTPERTHSMEKKEWHQTSVNVSGKNKRTQSPLNTMSDIANIKSVNIIEPNNKDNTRNTNSTTIKTTIKEKSSGAAIIKKTLPEMANKKSSNIVVGTQTKEVTHNTNSTTATSAAKEKSSGAAIIKKKVKTSSTNNTTNPQPTNNKNNSNNNIIFAKDKYDLIKSKEKQATNNEQQEAHKEKLKDKTSNHQTKPTTSSSSSSNIRLHKSSAKEKVKEKHKLTDKPITQTPNVIKLNISLSSNNKALNSLNSASNANSNVQKQISSKSSKSSSNSTASFTATATASANAILKAKTNLSTQTLNTANNGSQITTPTSTSASSAAASASPTVTIATTNHVRKKLKTK